MGGDDQNGTNLKRRVWHVFFFFYSSYSTNNNLQIDRLRITYSEYVRNGNGNHVNTRGSRQDASRALGLF